MRIPFFCLLWKFEESNERYARATLLYPWKIEQRFVDGDGESWDTAKYGGVIWRVTWGGLVVKFLLVMLILTIITEIFCGT